MCCTPRATRYRYYCLTFRMILFTCFEMRREAREIECSRIGGRCGATCVAVAYLYEVGKEQDVGGGRPHVSPWGIPRLPHIIDIPCCCCCCSSAAPSSTPPRSRWILHCPLVTPFLCILRSLPFSHPLSPNIIDLYYRHTALRRSFRSAHQHRISTGACPSRVEGRSFFLFAEH